MDICPVCGNKLLLIDKKSPRREHYKCNECRATMRYRYQAKAILIAYSMFKCSSLKELINNKEFIKKYIYEPDYIGYFRIFFDNFPNYYKSHFFKGKEIKGVDFQDITKLTYPDNYFDLIISSDVFEHVNDYVEGFKNIYRVLKSDGYHIFTIPLQDPAPVKTVKRCSKDGKKLKTERFHSDGVGGKCLVYTDFGTDLIDILQKIGFYSIYIKSNEVGTESIYTIISAKSPISIYI